MDTNNKDQKLLESDPELEEKVEEAYKIYEEALSSENYIDLKTETEQTIEQEEEVKQSLQEVFEDPEEEVKPKPKKKKKKKIPMPTKDTSIYDVNRNTRTNLTTDEIKIFMANKRRR